MEKDNKKIVINGRQYYNLEEVPEAFRETVKAKMAAAKTGAETAGASKITIRKEFNFQDSPELLTLLKWLVKISPPPGPAHSPSAAQNGAAEPQATIPADADTPDAEPENEPETGPELPKPEAIRPSSSGWIVALAVIGLAVLYFFTAK
ncbi:MAG: hypothetical protein WCW52_07535 [Elusimicrobiales bacterium]|jgi:hypothetical protein